MSMAKSDSPSEPNPKPPEPNPKPPEPNSLSLSYSSSDSPDSQEPKPSLLLNYSITSSSDVTHPNLKLTDRGRLTKSRKEKQDGGNKKAEKPLIRGASLSTDTPHTIKKELLAPPSSEMVVPSLSGKKERTTYTFRSPNFPNFFEAEWGAASQSNGQDGVKLSLLRNPHDTTQNTSFRVPAFPDGMPTAPVLVPNIRCQICDDNHSTGSCSYLREIPENTKIIEDSAFEIVCQCNKPIVGGACSGYCLPPLSRKVAPKHYPLCPPNQAP